nr:MAG TPA: hypothetical protein [Caudoviricetes sp.]
MSRLYEKVESNNFFEIDEERASDLIKGGNGHFVFNGIYMDLLEENKQIKAEKEQLELLVESLYSKTILNQEQEELLNKILFSKEEK